MLAVIAAFIRFCRPSSAADLNQIVYVYQISMSWVQISILFSLPLSPVSDGRYIRSVEQLRLHDVSLQK